MEQFQLFPSLTDDEYAALKADISRRGVQVPIEIDGDTGEVLDGHHRLRACRELEITDYPRVVRSGMSDDEKVEHVLALNLARRHLSAEQRTKLEADLRKRGWSYRRIAEKVGVDPMTVHNDLQGVEISTPDTVTGADGKSYPASKPKPHTIVHSDREQEKAQDNFRVLGPDAPAKPVQPKRLARIAREKQAEQRAREQLADPTPLRHDADVRHCDFRDLDIDIESVDLILTDPPYPREYLPLWTDLAAHAARWLKRGGLLVAMSGQFLLPEIMDRLAGDLDYVWCGAVTLTGPHNQVHPLRIRNRVKPLLFYSNGHYRPDEWFEDLHNSEGRDKSDHEWQQSVGTFRYYVEALTSPGDTVVDPFVGAGTTAVAAVDAGRRFVGCDVDAKAVAATRERLAS